MLLPSARWSDCMKKKEKKKQSGWVEQSVQCKMEALFAWDNRAIVSQNSGHNSIDPIPLVSFNVGINIIDIWNDLPTTSISYEQL